MPATGAIIDEIWIYPVKACQGIQVEHARLTPTGLELDRTWCLVDTEGTNITRNEVISQRRIPILASVTVALSQDKSSLFLQAPDMPILTIPTDLNAYSKEEIVQVESCEKSKTTGEGWSLGFVDGRVHAEGSAWFTQFLNQHVQPGGKLRSGFTKASTYALVRAQGQLDMTSYTPAFPVLEKAVHDESYRNRLSGNARRFADFAPFHLINKASARWVGAETHSGDSYPTRSFRANLIVGGEAEPWVEETWRTIQVVHTSKSGRNTVVTFSKIKDTPRCTVPCRDQQTGNFLFPKDSVLLWKVLRKAFPAKAKDPEWGAWRGPFFGVYFGHGGQEGTIHTGDSIRVVARCNWDDHLRWQLSDRWAVCAAVATESAQLWKAFKEGLPTKAKDPKWSVWRLFFGLYSGHGGQDGTIHIGDPTQLVARCLIWPLLDRWSMCAAVSTAMGIISAFSLVRAHSAQ